MNIYLQGRTYSPADFLANSEILPDQDYIIPVKNFLTFWLSGSDSLRISTSGSTSAPKEILISRKKIEASARMTLAFFQPNPQTDGFILCLPADKVGGMMVLARAILGGIDVLLLKPSLAPFFPISDFPADKKWLVSLVPPQFGSFFSAEELLEKTRNWKGILLGGAEIPGSWYSQIKKIQCPVFQSFGMTETVSHFALRKIWDPATQILQTEGPYQLLPGIEMSLSDRQTLQIKGEITDFKCLETHDLAEPGDKAGRSFYFLGRADDLVNSGGFKIHPDEISKSWQKHFSLLNLQPFFLGLHDPEWGEKLVMVLEGESLFKGNWEEIMEKWKLHLDSKKIPKAVYSLPAFPRTRTMKVDKAELKKLISASLPDWNKK